MTLQNGCLYILPTAKHILICGYGVATGMAKSFDMDEEEIDFRLEAEAVIKDIGFAVKSISISNKLPASRECVYLNVSTKESKRFCVELSVLGFLVVGETFDENKATSAPKYYETMNALLDSISPGYCHSFGEALVQKLSSLQATVDGKVNPPVPNK